MLPLIKNAKYIFARTFNAVSDLIISVKQFFVIFSYMRELMIGHTNINFSTQFFLNISKKRYNNFPGF